MFDHSLESSHRDNSNKWSNIGFGEEITQVELIEVNLKNLIWSSATICWNRLIEIIPTSCHNIGIGC